MNAKKIMGAVLVALLAAALFVGAGAAVSNYFAYQEVSGTSTLAPGVYQKGADTVTVTEGGIGVIVGSVPAAGTYSLVGNTDTKAYFSNPTATYSAIGNLSNVKYIIAEGGNVYAGSKVNITATPLASVAIDNLSVTDPTGAVEYVAGSSIQNMEVSVAGTYKVQAIWTDGFTEGAPLPAYDAKVFTFTVVDPSDATITASVDTVYAGGVIAVTIKGTPGTDYKLTLTGINGSVQQAANSIIPFVGYDDDFITVDMPNIGEVTLFLETEIDAKDEVKVVLSTTADGDIAEAVVAVAKSSITAAVDAESYIIGNPIELTLSSEVALPTGLVFTISGTNFKETVIVPQKDNSESTAKKFVYDINTAVIREAATVGTAVTLTGKALDVGTYTIKVYSGSLVLDGDKVKTDNLKKSVSVVLKQPFISVGEAPEVVVQGTEAKFIVNAEATTKIAAYVFGTNYFESFVTGTDIVRDGKVKSKFTLTLDESDTKAMDAGQYFAVFQHPMYDTKFNIASNGTEIVQNETADAFNNANVTVLFNVNNRQTANAAQALCDALDSQNIDDMYVKYSFFVVGENQGYSISEIPAEVVKGDKIVISGVDTANKGKAVQVEMISTAFAAVPKETVGSAAFIVVTTEVADDGTWEITLDTSDLNVDEYSLSVVINSVEKKTATVNVVEAGEPVTPEQPEQPEQPENPEEPVAPATPGFGALAALAGLGAVAVLLLRRE